MLLLLTIKLYLVATVKDTVSYRDVATSRYEISFSVSVSLSLSPLPPFSHSLYTHIYIELSFSL